MNHPTNDISTYNIDAAIAAAIRKDIPELGRDLTPAILERVIDERVRQEVQTTFRKALSLGTVLGIALVAFGASVWQIIARIFDSELDAFFSSFIFDANVIVERIGLTSLIAAGISIMIVIVSILALRHIARTRRQYA